MLNDTLSQLNSQISECSNPIENAADSKLAERGILEIARLMGWENGRHGWEYPVLDTTNQPIARRFKKYDSKADPKYFWLDDTKADYYHSGAPLLAAIAAANGVLILANGEPAVLACIAAGIQNVASFFGENKRPKTLIDDLKAWGVTTVYYCPDKDKTGLQAAGALRDLLIDSDIYFDCRALPDALAVGSDLNDLWQHVQFDHMTFLATLGALPAAILPEPKAKTAKIDYSATGNAGDLPQALIDDILKSLRPGRIEPRQRGDWLGTYQCLSQNHEHDHEKPAAYWHIKNHFLTCRKCGAILNAHDTAEALGLDPASYYPKRVPKLTQRRDEKAPRLSWPPKLPSVKIESIPAIQVNEQYFSNIKLPASWSTLAIKSPLGTGKTQFVIDHINQHQPRRVLTLTYLQSLVQNMNKRFNEGIQGQPFEHYQDIPGSYDLSLPDRLNGSLNSLIRVSPNAEAYDLVIIDEFEQVIRALWDGTLKPNEIVPVFIILINILSRAKKVIVLDAHLSAESIAFLRAECHRNVTAIENVYHPTWPKLKVYEHESSLIEAAIECANAHSDKPIIITTSSRKFARTCQDVFTERYGVDSIKLVYGWNSHEDSIRQFVANINSELPKVRVLITTPSLGTGIDVQCAVAGVFGYFPGKHIAPTGMLQQIARYRKAETFAVAIPLVHRHAPTDPEKLKTYERFKCHETRKIAGLTDDVSEHQGQLTRLWGSYKALDNRLTNNALATFVMLAEREGFPIEWVGGRSESIRSTLKASQQSCRENDDLLTLSLTALSPEAFEQKRRDKTLCENDYLALRRWHIENTTKQPMTTELLERYARKSDLDALVRLTVYCFGGKDEAAKMDRQDIEKLPFKRRHIALQLLFFSELIRLVFGENGAQSVEELTKDEIIRRIGSYFDDNRETILSLDSRADLSEDIFKMFRRMLKRWSINLLYRQVRINGKKLYVYHIDQDQLAVHKQDAQWRWSGLSQNAGNDNASTRDLRHLSDFIGTKGREKPSGWRDSPEQVRFAPPFVPIPPDPAFATLTF